MMSCRKIVKLAEECQDMMVRYRRDFHKFAEVGWLEIRTASIIAKNLKELGYEVLIGKEVCLDEARMGVPEQDKLDTHYKRALEQGADKEYALLVKDGFTGVIGVLHCGEGPVVAMRFDIDALGVIEDETEFHKPMREGFASVNYGSMHACGHDGHAAIGLGVAKVLMQIKDSLCGTIKLIFQPAEEGVRGAKSIVEAGHLDNVDYLLASHITGVSNEDATIGYHIIPGAGGSLATTKLDVTFRGKAAHAGGDPEKGKNTMLSMATAILNLYAIPRHSKGATRINVGTAQAGTGRNVIADEAKLEIEVRGETTEINEFVENYAVQILEGSAAIHGVECTIKKMGGAYSLESDQLLMGRISRVCEDEVGLKATPFLRKKVGGSEDVSYMMKRVQDHGGQASFIRVLGRTDGPGHSRQFDFDEAVLVNAVKIFCGVTYDILSKGEKV